MRKILLPILSTIFSLTTLTAAKQISAQTIINIALRSREFDLAYLKQLKTEVMSDR